MKRDKRCRGERRAWCRVIVKPVSEGRGDVFLRVTRFSFRGTCYVGFVVENNYKGFQKVS